MIYTFFGVEFEGESARIPLRVSRSLLPADSRESRKHWCPQARLAQKLGLAILGNVFAGHLKVAVSTGALCVDNALWNALCVKVGQLVEQVKVLQQTTQCVGGG